MRALMQHDSVGATRRCNHVCPDENGGAAVGRSCAAESRFEKRLRSDVACDSSATTASQPRDAAAVLQDRVGVGLLKLLPAQRHHVRNRIEVDGLVFVGDSASDVAELQGNPVGQLALNGEVERIGYVWPEMRIQCLAGAARRLATYPWEEWLRQGRTGYQVRGSLQRRDRAYLLVVDVGPIRNAVEGVAVTGPDGHEPPLARGY